MSAEGSGEMCQRASRDISYVAFCAREFNVRAIICISDVVYYLEYFSCSILMFIVCQSSLYFCCCIFVVNMFVR